MKRFLTLHTTCVIIIIILGLIWFYKGCIEPRLEKHQNWIILKEYNQTVYINDRECLDSCWKKYGTWGEEESYQECREECPSEGTINILLEGLNCKEKCVKKQLFPLQEECKESIVGCTNYCCCVWRTIHMELDTYTEEYQCYEKKCIVTKTSCQKCRLNGEEVDCGGYV